MSDNYKKRKLIFDKYADNLRFLIEHKLIENPNPRFDRTYICPICLEHFPEEALDQNVSNPLTLEDVPPKSLGGKANILTCKSCNNKCGQEIDHHLTERMKELDRSKFLPNTEFNAKFEKEGLTVQGTVHVDEEGNIKVIHSDKTNNPPVLETYIGGAKEDTVIDIKFLKSRVNDYNLQVALLKIGYLLTFAKFGYSFILDDTYTRIRNQLRRPTEQLYSMDFWFNPQWPKELIGVPFIIEPGLESVIPIFSLRTNVDRMFATIIPLNKKPIEEVLDQLKQVFETHSGYEVAMDGMEPSAAYLNNEFAIRKMLNWINNIKS